MIYGNKSKFILGAGTTVSVDVSTVCGHCIWQVVCTVNDLVRQKARVLNYGMLYVIQVRTTV